MVFIRAIRDAILGFLDSWWASVVGADGLAVVQDRMLFVTNNIEDKIQVCKLSTSGDVVSAEFQRDIVSTEYSTATTSAIALGYIYITNVRFYTTPWVNETDPLDSRQCNR